MSDLQLVFNEETGEFEPYKEPYAVMEFPTKEDYDRFKEMVDFWNEHHKED